MMSLVNFLIILPVYYLILRVDGWCKRIACPLPLELENVQILCCHWVNSLVILILFLKVLIS